MVRNEQKLVQIQKLYRLPCRLHVSSMGRVEGPAVDTNPAHGFTSFSLYGCSRPMAFSFSRWMARSMAVWRK
ncbi:unknown [Firmicutes bacterium CAG:137]|nr:unknown [Firmicutes bacterium CAG:137]